MAVGLVLVVVVGLRLLALDVVRVASTSMRPTLCEGDALVVLTPRAGRRAGVGDLVTFRQPDGVAAVKRVVASAGQVVEVRDAVLHVDGRAVREDYVDLRTVDGSYFGPVAVPPDSVFVMGDDRETSIDSRDYGAVPRSAVRGTVLLRLGGGC